MWVIVNDGSTDRTKDIIMQYMSDYQWIQLLNMPNNSERNFAAKANCFNAGYEKVKRLDFNIIGNLDADISFSSDYFEFLINNFSIYPDLGVAGTPKTEVSNDSFTDHFFNPTDVFGACQLFRRKCFEEIGGYTPIKWGGIDWVALRTARMAGWKTRSFLNKHFYQKIIV